MNFMIVIKLIILFVIDLVLLLRYTLLVFILSFIGLFFIGRCCAFTIDSVFTVMSLSVVGVVGVDLFELFGVFWMNCIVKTKSLLVGLSSVWQVAQNSAKLIF